MTVFINKGDTPLSVRQAVNRGIRVLNRDLTAAGARAGDTDIFTSVPHADLPQRLLDVLAVLPGSPATYADYAAAWEADNAVNAANNLFNHQLAAYRRATSRLAQYRLADGRPEETIETPTGTFDEEGNEIMSITVIPAIAALDAQVEENIFDEEGNLTGTQMVDNPLIVADDAERAEAQAVINATPAEVVAWN
jgi:hypothetical protein